mgnify:CR=1 FL=1
MIMGVIPISAAVGTASLTWIGTSYFADKMSDIRKGSYNVSSFKAKKVSVTPVERKGSAHMSQSLYIEDYHSDDETEENDE